MQGCVNNRHCNMITRDKNKNRKELKQKNSSKWSYQYHLLVETPSYIVSDFVNKNKKYFVPKLMLSYFW